LGPAINPTSTNRTKDTTPTMVALRLPSPMVIVATVSESMAILKSDLEIKKE